MLKELIKAHSEGDHDEVRCILAEAKDIKERKKREKLQKKEETFQIMKQEDVEFPNVNPPMSPDQPSQVCPHDLGIYSLIIKQCCLS